MLMHPRTSVVFVKKTLSAWQSKHQAHGYTFSNIAPDLPPPLSLSLSLALIHTHTHTHTHTHKYAYTQQDKRRRSRG